MAYPEPMTDIRQRIIQKGWEGLRDTDSSVGGYLGAAREAAILIRERLTEGDYHTGDVELAVIDDLLAALVSAETPQETP